MTSKMTNVERSYNKAVDDGMRLESLVLEQIATLLDGKTIVIEGKEVILKIGAWQDNNWAPPKMTVEALALTKEIERLRFSFKRERSDLNISE